jgi:hypothetical protein
MYTFVQKNRPVLVDPDSLNLDPDMDPAFNVNQDPDPGF